MQRSKMRRVMCSVPGVSLAEPVCVRPSLGRWFPSVCHCSQQPALGIQREAKDCFKSFSKGIFERFLAMENDLFLIALHLITGE